MFAHMCVRVRACVCEYMGTHAYMLLLSITYYTSAYFLQVYAYRLEACSVN